MRYDLLIKGGTLVDPAQGIHAGKDVAFTDGFVAAVEDLFLSFWVIPFNPRLS